MPLDFAPPDAIAATSQAQTSGNQRRYARAPLVLFGTCSLSDATNFPCHTRDLSASGIAVYAPVHAETGACASIWLERLGEFMGEVARSFAGGFAIELEIPQSARDRLAEQLAWMSTRSALGLIEDERHVTELPLRTIALRFGDEERVAEVIDVSSNGVAIKTDEALPVGLRVTVGTRSGRVLHPIEGGAAIEFTTGVKRLPSGRIDL